VIILIVALVVVAGSARLGGMSDSKTETMPWPEWAKSLGLVQSGADSRRLKKARHSVNFRMHAATNLTPIGEVAASTR